MALSEKIEDATYAIVMEGMGAYGLDQAVRAALNGKHGSKFYPNPAELRQLYDKAMEHYVHMRERIARREQIERERVPEIPPLTEAAKERQRQRMERFHKAMPDPEPKPEVDWDRVNERFDPKPEPKQESAE